MIVRTMLKLSIVIITGLVNTCRTQMRYCTWNSKIDGAILRDHDLLTQNGVTYDECKGRCKDDPRCMSITYMDAPPVQTCQLKTHNKTTAADSFMKTLLPVSYSDYTCGSSANGMDTSPTAAMFVHLNPVIGNCTWNRGKEGVKLAGTNEKVRGETLDECMVYCQQKKLCSSVSFQHTGTRCLVNANTTSTDPDNVRDDSDYTYYDYTCVPPKRKLLPVLIRTFEHANQDMGFCNWTSGVPEMKLAGGNNVYSEDGGTFERCIKKCEETSTCKSVSFRNTPTTRCLVKKNNNYTDPDNYIHHLYFTYFDYKCDFNGECPRTIGEPPIECRSLSEIQDKKLNSSDNNAGVHVGISCPIGTWFPDHQVTHHIICQCNGQWSDGWNEDCEDVTCPLLSTVDSMQDKVLSTELDKYLTQVDISCKPGYRYIDNTSNRTVTCQQNGTWSAGWDDVCEVVTCPLLSNVASMQFKNLTTVSNTYPTQVNISCPLHYWYWDRTSTRTVICQQNGAWSTGWDDACQAIKCPLLNNNRNSVINSTLNFYLTTVNISCHQGYQFSDGNTTRIVTCDLNGKWSEGWDQSCAEMNVRCPYIVTSLRVQLNTTDTESGTAVLLTCRYGYNANTTNGPDQLVTVCQQNGAWSQSILDFTCPGTYVHERANWNTPHLQSVRWIYAATWVENR